MTVEGLARLAQIEELRLQLEFGSDVSLLV